MSKTTEIVPSHQILVCLSISDHDDNPYNQMESPNTTLRQCHIISGINIACFPFTFLYQVLSLRFFPSFPRKMHSFHCLLFRMEIVYNQIMNSLLGVSASYFIYYQIFLCDARAYSWGVLTPEKLTIFKNSTPYYPVVFEVSPPLRNPLKVLEYRHQEKLKE